MKLTRQLHDILLLPTGEQRHPLRTFVKEWCIQNASKIEAQSGKTYSNWISPMSKANLLLLADLIAYYEDKVSSIKSANNTLTLEEVVGTFDNNVLAFDEMRDTFLNGVYISYKVPHGEVAGTSDNDKPLLEGVTAEDILRMFVDIANETGCNDNDMITEAVWNACRIHSSFEPIFKSAMETWKDCSISDCEVEWGGSSDAFDKLRHCHNHSCAYITGRATTTAQTDGKLKTPDDASAAIVNTIMTKLGLPNIEDVINKLNRSSDDMSERDTRIAELEQRVKQTALAPSTQVSQETKGNGTIPNGKLVLKKAHELFDMPKKDFDFEVNVWEWDAPNPHVPEIDPHYIFRPEELFKFLYAMIMNQRAYFWGDTGTGKTTLIEQGCARMNYMFNRINFDSDIGRFDLVGRDTLISDGTRTVSKFIEGALPQAMANPTVLCCDEIDFCRPDTAYVMQSALEGNGLTLMEDGGRIVKPHSMFRMFATGNTQGQGDEKGMYAGARNQSMALLDRFTVWAKVDYLNSTQRKQLLKKKCPSLEKNHIDMVCQYVTEHMKAFEDSRVFQPMSPRGMISLGNAVATFTALDPNNPTKAIQRAFDTTILERATTQDHAVFKGITQRVVK